jgi:hypothetical protein
MYNNLKAKVNCKTFYPPLIQHYIASINGFIEGNVREGLLKLVNSAVQPLEKVQNTVFSDGYTIFGQARQEASAALDAALSDMKRLQALFEGKNPRLSCSDKDVNRGYGEINHENSVDDGNN